MNVGGLKKRRASKREALKALKITAIEAPDKEGFLVKRGDNRATWNKRYVVLKGSTLYYFKKKGETSPLKGTIELTPSSIAGDTQLTTKKHAFEVAVLGRTFVIRASSEKDKKKWVKAINANIAALRTKGDADKDGSAQESNEEQAKDIAEDDAKKEEDVAATSASESPKEAKADDEKAKEAQPAAEEKEKQKDKPKSSKGSSSSSSEGESETKESSASTTTTTVTAGGNHQQASSAGGALTDSGSWSKAAPKAITKETEPIEQTEEDKHEKKEQDEILIPLENKFPRLLHLSGKGKNINVASVPVSAKSLNLGDVFILDNDTVVMQWNPPGASIFEKNKGAALTRAIDDYRNVNVQILVIDSNTSQDANRFWEILGGKIEDVPNEAPEKGEIGSPPQLYHVRFADEESKSDWTFDPIDSGYRIKSSLLDSSKVYVVDVGFEIYLWVGLKSKAFSEQLATDILTRFMRQYPDRRGLHVHRVLEDGENEVLKHFLAQ